MSKYYFSETKNPVFNSATEEYIANSCNKETVLFLYQNSHSSPKEQLAYGINTLGYAFMHNEEVILNHSMILQDALRRLDTTCETNGNILYIDGKAISQNMEYTIGNCSVNKGVIFLDDIKSVLQALDISPEFYTNIHQTNRWITKSILASAIKYSFEHVCGKATEFIFDKQSIANVI